MLSQVYLMVIFLLAAVWGYYAYKVRHYRRQAEKTQQKLTAVEAEKAVVETQVKHFEVRKKNEENTRSTRRDDVIDRLLKSSDLRD